MKKKILAWFCILSMCITITGCKSTQDSTENDTQESSNDSNSIEVSKGRYKEFMLLDPVLESNETDLLLAINNEGNFERYTVQNTENYLNSFYSCYTYVDGRSQKSAIDWVNKAASEFSFVPADYCHGEDGTDYLLYTTPSTYDTKGQPEYDKRECGVLKKVQGTDTYIDITPAYWEPGTEYYKLRVTKDGVLCYIENMNLVFYDSVKKELVNYGNFTDISDYVIQENTLYYIDRMKNEIQIVQLSENKVEEIALVTDAMSSDLQVSSKGDIILLNAEGIHRYRKGGTMWETILDGKDARMSSPSFMILSSIVVPGTYDTYYILYLDLTTYKTSIAEYRFNDNSNDLQKRELTIYSLYKNISLEHAIYSYSQLHQDVTINLVEMLSYEDTINPDGETIRSEVIRDISTEILAGKDVDIILMDGLPISSYIEKGILMDMSECCSDLLPGIAKNYTQDGKIYCMPMRLLMPVFVMRGDISEYTKSIEDLADYCLSSERSLMNPLCYNSLVKMFLYIYGSEIFTEGGALSPENLSSFLVSINEIAIKTGATEDGDRGTLYLNFPISESALRIRNALCGDLSFVYSRDVQSAISVIGDYTDLSRVCTYNKVVSGRYIPLNDIFIPDGTVGISKNAKDVELAKDFVKYLLSEEVQSLHLQDGFPVNDKALTAWSQEPYNKEEWVSMQGEEGTIHSKPATVEEKQRVIEELRTLSKPVVLDTVCWDILLKGTLEYLRGEKDLEQATSEISQKVNLYLSE